MKIVPSPTSSIGSPSNELNNQNFDYAATVKELRDSTEKKLLDELCRKDAEIQLQIEKRHIAEANLTETHKELRESRDRELLHARKAAMLAKELKDERFRHAAEIDDLQVKAEKRLAEELVKKDKELNRDTENAKELVQAELDAASSKERTSRIDQIAEEKLKGAELSSTMNKEKHVYKQIKLNQASSDSAVTQTIELPVQLDRDKEIDNIRRLINESEIARAKLIHKLAEAQDRLKKASSLDILEEDCRFEMDSTSVVLRPEMNLKKHFKADGSIKLDLQLSILRCHDIFICPYEVSHMPLRNYLKDVKSKLFRVCDVPGKTVLGHLSEDESDLRFRKYIIPPRRKHSPPVSDLRKMSPLGKLVMTGIIDAVFRLQRYGLSLNGQFTLDSFHITANKKIKLDPVLKSLVCTRAPDKMKADYATIPSVIEEILSLYSDSYPVPFDLRHLLDLLSCENPVANEVIIRYNVSLIQKRDHFITLYDRLQQIDNEDKEKGQKDSRSDKVLKFIKVAGHDDSWRDELHNNKFVARSREKNRVDSSHKVHKNEKRNLLDTWRHNFTHLHELSTEFQDKDEADILDSIIPGVINQFQEGMHSIGEIDIPHLVATMKM